ncbi:MAG: hypothetical protein L6Q66_07355 [Bacteroidia bacterium]|nr:hypothetical protein [Bacteroidia bacterium]
MKRSEKLLCKGEKKEILDDYMTVVKSIILTLIIGFFCSCSSTNSNTEQISATNFKTKDTAISFTGYWLSKDYFESIKKIKSPKNAQDNSEFIFIPSRTLKQTMMISNFHEGGPTLTILSNGNQYELWEIQEDTLKQQLNIIEIINETNIKIGDCYFVKINPLQSGNSARILEEILFKGIYTNASGGKIEFKNNGQVIGLENFKVFEPVIDYIDAGMQVDQLGLGQNKNEFEYFGFKFKKDTLELFKLICLTFDSINNRCVEVELGELRYKLWEAKN